MPKQTQAFDILTEPEYGHISELLYGGGAGGGKAQALDSIIYTPFGKKRMGDIKIGDVICHPSGSYTTVIAIHPQGIKEMYEIEFIDGAKTLVCGDHLWYVWFARRKSKQERKSGNKGKIQTTEMLVKKLHRHPIIPLCSPVNFTIPKNRYIKPLIHPYILGVLIGDGSLVHDLSFTTIDSEIADRVNGFLPDSYFLTNRKLLYRIVYKQHNENGYCINPMRDEIRKMGLNCKSEHKFIPAGYLCESKEVRLSIIQGLMDTDGTIDRDGRVSYSTSSEKLAIDVQYLCRSLGFKATISKKTTKHLDSYCIYINGNDCLPLFTLTRKKERVTKYNGGFSECGRRMVGIKSAGRMEAQCITVDNPDGLYITDDFIVTHNSILGCAWLINQCANYRGTRWLMGRKALKTLKETTLNSFFFIAREGGVKYRYIENKGIIFPNGSEILLKDLAYYPSDPEYTELGSLEITGAFVDECNQITEKCWNIVKSRIRYRLDEYGLTPKILGTCNPTRNWVYDRFYKPFINGKPDSDKMFIQSLVEDNYKVSKHYEANLRGLDEMSRERLLYGNWEYMDISNLWTYAFRREKHTGICELNRSESVFLSFDFNRDPIVCSVYQHYGDTIYCLEVISINDATIYRLCDEIKARYDGCFFFVTGDISGKTRTTTSQLNNFDVIKYYFGLSKNQMQYSGSNPPLAENRILVNAMLEQCKIVFDKEKCKELIFDFEHVKSDKEGKPVKNNRDDETQRADCLDTFRYYLNRYFSDHIKFFVR
jgi:hypothetical protein